MKHFTLMLIAIGFLTPKVTAHGPGPVPVLPPVRPPLSPPGSAWRRPIIGLPSHGFGPGAPVGKPRPCPKRLPRTSGPDPRLPGWPRCAG